MPELNRARAALRIVDDALDIEYVTRTLGVVPTFAHRKGEVRAVGSVRLPSPTGIWSLESPLSGADGLDAHLNAILDLIPAAARSCAEVSSRYSAEFFCGLFMASANEGLTLEPGTIRRAGDRGFGVGLDIYANLDEERSDDS